MKSKSSRAPETWRANCFRQPLIVVFLHLALAASALADVEIRARWAASTAAAPTPVIDGVITTTAVSIEWSNAVVTPIAHGEMRTMNNGEFLYLLLDLGDDTVNDSLPADYFVLTFDADRNRAVTPNVDLDYGVCGASQPFTKSYYLSPTTSTPCSLSSRSQGAAGFGSSPRFPVTHRIWEFRLQLAEVGADPTRWTTSSGDTPSVRVHVSAVSASPAFVSAQPDPAILPNFAAEFFKIDLSILPSYPPGTAGLIFAGVGLVPSSYIDSLGYATMNVPGYYEVFHAPFGGKLNIFGNWNTLRAYGAGKYRVLYSKDGGPFTRLLQTWTNFRYDGTTWIPTAVGPAADGSYAVPSASMTWYLPDLLMGWQSDRFGDGSYILMLELISAAATPLADPGPANRLTTFVVNTPPTIGIPTRTYDGHPICECAIVNQGDAPRGLNWTISVNDPNGALNAITFEGTFGNGHATPVLYTNGYVSNGHVDMNGPRRWNGVTDLVIPPATPFRATASCAHTFTLSASSRAQNGYSPLYFVRSNISLTILRGSGAGSADCPPPTP